MVITGDEDLDLQLRSADKAVVVAVGHLTVTKTRESQQIQVQQKSCSMYFDFKGTVHRIFVWTKIPKLQLNPSCLLHHSILPPQSSHKMVQFLTENMAVIPHLPCSPDLTSCYFVFFPKIKLNLRSSVSTHWMISKRNRRQHLTAVKKWLPRCFWNVEKALGSMCKFSRGLLQK